MVLCIATQWGLHVPEMRAMVSFPYQSELQGRIYIVTQFSWISRHCLLDMPMVIAGKVEMLR